MLLIISKSALIIKPSFKIKNKLQKFPIYNGRKQRKKKLLIRKIIKINAVVVLIGAARYYFVKEKLVSNELAALITK
jgi:hypothetical protein